MNAKGSLIAYAERWDPPPLGSFGLSWFFDGHWIAYYTKEGGSYDVFLMRLGDLGTLNLTNNPGKDLDPA